MEVIVEYARVYTQVCHSTGTYTTKLLVAAAQFPNQAMRRGVWRTARLFEHAEAALRKELPPISRRTRVGVVHGAPKCRRAVATRAGRSSASMCELGVRRLLRRTVTPNESVIVETVRELRSCAALPSSAGDRIPGAEGCQAFPTICVRKNLTKKSPEGDFLRDEG